MTYEQMPQQNFLDGHPSSYEPIKQGLTSESRQGLMFSFAISHILVCSLGPLFLTTS